MRLKFAVLFCVSVCAVSGLVSCLPAYDRPARVYIEYVDRACVATPFNSAGTEMEELDVWPGRVVFFTNKTDCVVTIQLPKTSFTSWNIRLNPGASKSSRVKSSASHGEFYYDVNCCVVPGSSGGSAGPKGQIDDDSGGP